MCGSPLRRVRGEPNCDAGVQRTSGGCHVRHRHIIGTVEPYSRVQVAMLPHKRVLGPNTTAKTPSPNHRRRNQLHISTTRKQNSRVRRIDKFCTFNYVTSISYQNEFHSPSSFPALVHNTTHSSGALRLPLSFRLPIPSHTTSGDPA